MNFFEWLALLSFLLTLIGVLGTLAGYFRRTRRHIQALRAEKRSRLAERLEARFAEYLRNKRRHWLDAAGKVLVLGGWMVFFVCFTGYALITLQALDLSNKAGAEELYLSALFLVLVMFLFAIVMLQANAVSKCVTAILLFERMRDEREGVPPVDSQAAEENDAV